jgi:hypothetical protein
MKFRIVYLDEGLTDKFNFGLNQTNIRNQDSSVFIAMGYGAGWVEFDSWLRQEIFSSL